jgi:hypothetical protein
MYRNSVPINSSTSNRPRSSCRMAAHHQHIRPRHPPILCIMIKTRSGSCIYRLRLSNSNCLRLRGHRYRRRHSYAHQDLRMAITRRHNRKPSYEHQDLRMAISRRRRLQTLLRRKHRQELLLLPTTTVSRKQRMIKSTSTLTTTFRHRQRRYTEARKSWRQRSTLGRWSTDTS